jgi:hypothetical protein
LSAICGPSNSPAICSQHPKANRLEEQRALLTPNECLFVS